MSSVLIALIVIVLLALWLLSIYNKLVLLRNRIKNAFSQIDVQLKRRYDLIPNLVETAKAYMSHEKNTLEAVIEARNRAKSAVDLLSSNPANIGSFKELQGAESSLQGALSKLFALSESYPELKANQNMLQLSEELASTENKVAFARQAFNDAVTEYNVTRESIPANFFASSFGFSEAQQFKVEKEEEKNPVKVSF